MMDRKRYMQDITFTNLRGVSVYAKASVPEVAKSIIIFQHGFAEHSGRYAEFVSYLNAKNIGVVVSDMQGHGNSTGERGDIDDIEFYIGDLNTLFREVKNLWKSRQVYVCGQGMGANIAALTVASGKIEPDGLIMSAPLLNLDGFIPRAVREMAKYVATITPSVPVFKPDLSKLSRNTGFVEMHQNDPLNYNYRLSARTATNLIKCAAMALASSKEITCPLFLLQGSDDSVSKPETAAVFLDEVPAKDKTLKVLDGYFHELFFEPENEQVYDAIASWVAGRTKKSAPQPKIAKAR